MNVFLKHSSIKQQPNFVSSCFVMDENTYLTLFYYMPLNYAQFGL